MWGAKTGRRSLEGISAAFSFDRTVFVTDEEGEALAREYFADFPRSFGVFGGGPFYAGSQTNPPKWGFFEGGGRGAFFGLEEGGGAGFATSAWKRLFRFDDDY